MENNTDSTNESTLEKKPNKYKSYFWILISLNALTLIFFIYQNVQDKKAEEIQRKETARLELERQKHIQDSLVVVKRNRDEYIRQTNIVNNRNSAFSQLRYHKGSIVYLKPDSTAGVVKVIATDSLMLNFYYYVKTTNKDGSALYYEVEDPLVY